MKSWNWRKIIELLIAILTSILGTLTVMSCGL